jgi:hypothetical protein
MPIKAAVVRAKTLQLYVVTNIHLLLTFSLGRQYDN